MNRAHGESAHGFIFVYCLFFIICKLQVISAKSCEPVDQCTCKTDDGKYVSLWEIDIRFINVPDASGRGFTYSYQPCTAFTDPYSECKDALACQKYDAAKFAIAFKPNKIDSKYVDSVGMYVFSYTGSKDKDKGKTRQTVINLKCDQSATTPSLDAFLESPEYYYTSTLTTKCACPGGCKYNKKENSTKPKSGLSIGSILCIILLVLVTVYLIGGILYRKYSMQKQGWDVVPNREFWKDLPILAKDGVLFSYQKMKGTKTEYQQLS